MVKYHYTRYTTRYIIYKSMEKLLEFIKKQRIMVIASCGDGEVWVANVYADIDDEGVIYFVSSDDTKHSKMIAKNPNVAFSFAWAEPNDSENRKGIQGQGHCRKAEDVKEIVTGLALLVKKLPVFKKFFTLDRIQANKAKGVWVIEPTKMKYWDDERYGNNSSEEFTF